MTSPSADEPDDASATWTVEPLRPLPEHTLVSPGSRADPVEPRNAVLADEIDPLALTLLQEGTPQSVVRTGDHGAPTDVDARNSPATADAYPASRSRLEVTEEHLGRYRMIDDESRRELGRGGIGRVFAAFDRHLNREVAIKELLSESGGGTSAPGSPAMTRFLREARVTGQLEHPNIIPVYELGRRADGTLYYAMRIVRGRTLAGAIADAGDLDERLALVNHFSGLCQAIAYAHSRGVVHRDVKPENVMIGEFGETIVLDWGTAKLRGYCDDKVSASTIRKAEDPSLGETVEGSLFGTPIYMSPEQALGRVSEVDERSDVWALGVVLYTILARQAPFGGRTFVEVRKQLEKGSFRPLSQVDRRIPPELAAIVKRALRVSPGQRYETAREMARDVQAYQAGGRVGAYEYTSLELLKRFLARQRAAVICSLVGLVAVIVLAAATYQRVVAARDRALLAERRALDNEQSAGASAKAARRSLSEMLVEKAALAQADGDVVAAELLAGHALDLGERPDARGIVLAAGASMRPMPVGHLIEASGCDHYAMASRVPLLVCAKHRSVRAWNMGERKAIWDNEEGLAPVTALAISADGQRLLTASAVGVRFHASPFAGPTIVVERRIGRVSAIALSADGKLAAAGTSYGAVVVWDTQNAGGERRYGLGQAISALLFGPRGELVAGGELGAVSVWNPEKDHELKMKGHAGTVRALALAQDGRILASGGADRAVHLWDTQDGRSISAPIRHSDAITSIAISADARRLIYGSTDKSFRITDSRGLGNGVRVAQHDEAIELVALSADDSELVSVSKDSGARSWSLAALKTSSQLVERGNVLSLAFNPKTRDLLSAGLGRNGICLWDLRSASCTTRLPANVDRVRALAVSPDGAILAVAGSGGQVFLWDLTRRIPTTVLDGHRDEVRALTFSTDGRRLASASLDRTIRVVSTSDAAGVASFTTQAPVQGLSFIPGAAELLSGDRDGVLEIWNVARGERTARWKAHDDWILCVATSFDGRWLASAGGDRFVRIWNAKTKTLAFDLVGSEGRVTSLDFSADGSLLASTGEDKVVRIWQVESGKELARLGGHEGTVRSVRFAPSAPTLASGSDDGTIRLWDLSGLYRPASEIIARTEHQFGVELSGTRVIWKAPSR